MSLSSWRAWIEIGHVLIGEVAKASLSSWRAWIEILTMRKTMTWRTVALLMESVD